MTPKAPLIALALIALIFMIHTRSNADPVQSLTRADEWLNSDALEPEDLKGKVVLVHFWTYTCVNWMRTLPYVRAWHEKYRKDGLIVIGVHSPEFGFERKTDNVRRAMEALNVPYPIAVDSDLAIWRAYDNRYWPALYLLDSTGHVRFHHFGEGEYERIEQAVQSLLAERNGKPPVHAAMPVQTPGVELAADWKNLRSGENYLGRERTVNFASPQGLRHTGPRRFSTPERLGLNDWALAGAWTITPEASVLDHAPGRIAYRFHARDVNLVMGVATLDHPVRFRVLIDGKPPGAAHGVDVDEHGNGTVTEPRMYQLIRQPTPIVDRTIEIEFLDDEVAAFSFTFG